MWSTFFDVQAIIAFRPCTVLPPVRSVPTTLHCGKAELYTVLLLDQTGDHGPSPQTAIQTVLAGIFAVAPGKYLLFLARTQ
jgi:hypothetical protein